MIRKFIEQIKLLEKRSPWFAEIIKILRLRVLYLKMMWGYRSLRYSIRMNLLKLLLGQPKAVLYKTQFGKILLHSGDATILAHIAKDETWEDRNLELIKISIKALSLKKTELLCVGSHVGILAIPLAEHCKKVTAIEANPETYQLLKANIAINEKTNIETHNIAAWNKRSTLNFLVFQHNSGSSRMVPKKQPPSRYYFDEPDVIKVPAVRLDDLLKDRKFEIIVMDIEGAETAALQGAKQIFKNVKMLIIEFHPWCLRYMADVSLADFIAELKPIFNFLYIPSLKIKATKNEFEPVLQQMCEHDIGDEGLIFTKIELPPEIVNYKRWKAGGEGL